MTKASEELLRCCDRQNLRTLFRGAAGCIEECQRCGFAYGYDGDGEPTSATITALAALANKATPHG